jgi:hypothetical protein
MVLHNSTLTYFRSNIDGNLPYKEIGGGILGIYILDDAIEGRVFSTNAW